MTPRMSWRDSARLIIEDLLVEACQRQPPTKREFLAFLRENYPWSPVGWAYKSWQKERAIAVEYLALIQKGQAKPENFVPFSLARMRNSRSNPEPIEGQQSLFRDTSWITKN